MLIRFGFGFLYAGRPSMLFNEHDASLSLGLWPRRHVPPGEIAWHFNLRITWDWLPVRIYRDTRDHRFRGLAGTVDHTKWTGRRRALVGFGGWRRSFDIIRTTWSSRMYVYLTGTKEKADPHHVKRVSPAAVLPANEVPAEWKEVDGSPKTIAVDFYHGRASVPENLGKWLIETGQAHKTNIIRARGASALGALAAAIAGNPA